jgi:hypothetical protein
MSNDSTSAESSAVICLQKVVDESLSPVVCQRALNLDTCLGRSLVLRIESDSVLSVVIDIYKEVVFHVSATIPPGSGNCKLELDVCLSC